jgi:hypothetical protein
MGATKTTSNNQYNEESATLTTRDSDGWAHVHLHGLDVNPLDQISSTAQGEPTPTQVNRTPNDPHRFRWNLLLQSLVLANLDNDIPISFLQCYPLILQKFPGPPCIALGKTIGYLQAILTESPGFHPYVTRLPFGSVPASEAAGRKVAEVLEFQLIRIIQRLFAFFYGDVQSVQRYVNCCQAELIPAPVFVLISPPNGNASASILNGVQSFNNGVQSGEKSWQDSGVWSPQAISEALAANLKNCGAMLTRKWAHPRVVPTPVRQQPRPALPPLGPASFQSPPVPSPFTAPNHLPSHPQQAQTFGPNASSFIPSRPPQIFHVAPAPLPMQFPAQPQVNSIAARPLTAPPARTLPPAHLAANNPTQPDNRPRPVTQTPRPVSPPAHPLKEEIVRLEAQMARLVALVDRDTKQQLPPQ